MKSMSALSEIKSVGPPNIQNIISPSVDIRYPSTLQTSKMRWGSLKEFDNINYLGTCKHGRKEPPTLIKKNVRLIN